MKKTILALMLLLACIVVSGCQTVAGLGGDVRWTGQQVEAVGANLSPE